MFSIPFLFIVYHFCRIPSILKIKNIEFSHIVVELIIQKQEEKGEVKGMGASELKFIRLLRLMQKTEPDEQDKQEFSEISRQINYLKHDKKGVQEMCDLMEKYMAEGKEETRKEMLVKALKDGISVDQLVSIFNATEEEIRECENELNQNT